MIFQTLDDKKDCVAVYDGKNIIKEIPGDISKTWSYSCFLKDKNIKNDIQYANLYCEGKTLIEVCPDDLSEDWKKINDKLKSFFNSFKEAKIDLRQNCFYDLVPERFLLEYCYYKNQITEYVLNNYEKPKNYNFLRDMTELVSEIKFNDLSINVENIELENRNEFINKIQNKKTYIDYDIFGSITGRMSVKKHSFPILNLNKSFRSAIEPTNDWFVELDMNGAELRTAFALLDKEQISGDHHEWSSREIFKNKLNRTEAKNLAISWLYNSSSKLSIEYDSVLSSFYDKQYLLEKYYKDGYVHTPYDRIIEADLYHAINYLIQSTLIDLFHRQVLKLKNVFLNKLSKIAFLIHDCVVLDLKEEEKELLIEAVKVLSDTKYGNFPINIKIGNNYGNMKKVKLKV